jgi:hypothetical protein
LPVAVNARQNAPSELKCQDSSKMMKNVPENPKIKIVRNDRGKLRTSPKRPHGLPKTFKLNKLTQTSTFINMIMKTFYIPSKLEILFINLCINNMYFIKNLLIGSTLQPLMVQMGSVDRSILAPKPFRKSVGTFWTRPELPVIISDNFDFWVFNDFFSSWLFHLNPATSQISDHQELKKLARQL